MTASQLILKLQELIASHGDLVIAMKDWSEHWKGPSSVESVRYEVVDTQYVGEVFLERYGFVLDD